LDTSNEKIKFVTSSGKSYVACRKREKHWNCWRDL